jgi:hypothetical protein
MYARRVSLKLKPDTSVALTETLEKNILPLLRKAKGFQDEITFVSPDGQNAFGISLWDRAESAEAYSRDTYPQVVKLLEKVTTEAPQVGTYEVSNSTFHKIAAAVTV